MFLQSLLIFKIKKLEDSVANCQRLSFSFLPSLENAQLFNTHLIASLDCNFLKISYSSLSLETRFKITVKRQLLIMLALIEPNKTINLFYLYALLPFYLIKK